MLILSFIIYFILTIIAGPLWPLQLLSGKAGPIGYFVLLGWLSLFIAGLNS